MKKRKMRKGEERNVLTLTFEVDTARRKMTAREIERVLEGIVKMGCGGRTKRTIIDTVYDVCPATLYVHLDELAEVNPTLKRAR
jgi:hypothetical protein